MGTLAHIAAAGIIAGAIASAGCDSSWNVPGAVLSPEDGAGLGAGAWEAEVGEAAATWNAELEARGCAPVFALGDGGHPIRLVPAAAWRWGTTTMGITTYGPDEIEIRVIPDLPGGTPAYQRYLLHELGHALGIHGHLPDGVMAEQPRKNELSSADVDAAVDALGCAV